MISNLYSRKDDPFSIEIMNDLFLPKKNLVWFIENEKTKEWVAEDSDHVVLPGYNIETPFNKTNKHVTAYGETWKCLYDSIQLTNDPLKAKKFDTQMRALTYCIQNHLGPDYIQTEHEFIN